MAALCNGMAAYGMVRAHARVYSHTRTLTHAHTCAHARTHARTHASFVDWRACALAPARATPLPHPCV
eukprot:6191764-Pleurochrysis_carterae.AAC.1